jgi:capsular exopolysaccharide synthesis family protein
MESKPRSLALGDYFRIARKRGGIIVLIILSAAIMGMVFGTFAPKRYRASSTVQVTTTPRQLIIWGGQGSQGLPPEAMSLETQAALVGTSVVADKAAEWLTDPARCEEPMVGVTADEIRETLSVTTEEPDLIRISATVVEDGQKAKMFAIAAAEGLVAYIRERATEDIELTKKFLQQQVRETRVELDAKMEALARHQKRSGVVDVAAESQDVIKGLSALEQMRDEAAAEAREHESVAAALRRRLSAEPPLRAVPTEIDNPEYAELQRELARKQVERYEALSKYTPNHPAVKNLEADVAALEEGLARVQSPTMERRTLVENDVYRELQTSLAEHEASISGARARLAAIENAVRRQQSRKTRLPKDQLESGMLQQELEVVRETYRRLLERLKDAEIEEAGKKPPASIVDRPSRATNVSLSVRKTLLFSIFIGVVVAVGVVLILEFTDTAIRDADDITREFGVPVLGVIPFRREAQLHGTGQRLPSDDDDLRPRRYYAHAGEAYRTLRSNIRFVAADRPVRSLLVTSAGVGEGKSITCANLAVVMAQAGYRVVLVDADLRRPRLYEYFDFEERDMPGLTAVLGGYRTLDEVLLTPDPTALPTLQLLTSGAIPPNPAELLASERMSELIEQIKARADYVLLDSPPAMMLTDAAVLAGRVDGVLLLVEAGKVPKAVFADMCDLIRRAHGRILGAVLNKRRYQAGDYYYYYHYYEDTGETGKPPPA